MRKISDNLDFTKPDNWDEIYNIKFVFHKKKKTKYNARVCQNIIAFDTETSNGFMLPDGHVVGFEHEPYDRALLKEAYAKEHNIPINYTDQDIIYKTMIDNAKPVGLTYFWQVAVEDGYGGIKKFIGRTWEEFTKFHEKLHTEILRQAVFGVNSVDRDSENTRAKSARPNITALEFVHNLGFDWQGLQNPYHSKFTAPKDAKENNHVFARNSRKPIKSTVRLHGVTVEYRDTAIFAQKKLAAWADDCPNCPLKKLPDFDYLTIKTPLDALTADEIHYGINDTAIIVYCMEYERKAYKWLEDIPLTQTGKVRRVLHRDVCEMNYEWSANCWYQTVNYTPDYFKKLVLLYQGGYTHANCNHTGHILRNCVQFDFASSYPSVLTNGKFPVNGLRTEDVSKFAFYEQQDVELGDYRWFAKILIRDKFKTRLSHTYWSSSKVVEDTYSLAEMNLTADNGRIFRGDKMEAYFTDTDWYTFKRVYKIKNNDFEVVELFVGEADYIPWELARTILNYYKGKTNLKGLDDRVSEYIESKQFVNGIYGCFVFKLFADDVIYSESDTGELWKTLKLDDIGFAKKQEDLKPESEFGFFELGVWTSALARKRLWDFIVEFDDKVWYCDTDSIKGEFGDKELKFVEDYNKWIADIEELAIQHHRKKFPGIADDVFTPKTQDGEIKRLGIMEREPDCEFKTLGAKRYVEYLYNKKKKCMVYEATIAGLPKSAGAEKIKSFDDFNNNTLWLTSEAHKVCCYYNDNQPETIWTGRDGAEYKSNDKYGVCLKPVTFDLSVTPEYIKFFDTIQCGYDEDNEMVDDVYDTIRIMSI